MSTFSMKFSFRLRVITLPFFQYIYKKKEKVQASPGVINDWWESYGLMTHSSYFGKF